MSVDLNWETVTGGPDGQELAHKIRDFIHTKFQSVRLPRFIKSVTVHDFEFGSIPPEIELKDITDPLPDFYEENSDVDDDDDSDDGAARPDDTSALPDDLRAAAERSRRGDMPPGPVGGTGLFRFPPPLGFGSAPGARFSSHVHDLSSPFLGVSTPGIFGGASNLHYFHSHFGSGRSGSQTPLAAVAGAQHLGSPWLEPGGGHGHGHGHGSSSPSLHHQPFASRPPAGAGSRQGSRRSAHSRNASQSSISVADLNPGGLGAGVASASSSGALPTGLGIHTLNEKHSVSTLAATSIGASRPPTRDAHRPTPGGDDSNDGADGQRRFREQRVDDMQAVFRIKYAGDIKLLLTADILLDYPMPSFVGIPLRLSITGLTFDGVGVLAHIRKRVHFCFLSPEDALAAVGGEENLSSDGPADPDAGGKIGGLLQEIRVESEIGQREGGKQSLKNVGKVERFVLEQVRRIFEEEFVYPSFWTFLV